MWIEIILKTLYARLNSVTLFAGVWIEITGQRTPRTGGLVTPFAGVWIEIYGGGKSNLVQISHSLRGSVD